MKKAFYFLTLFPILLIGQPTITENYIKTTTYKKPTSQGSVNTSNPADATIKVTYFDGLGRPIQQIDHKQSGIGTDVLSHMQYDAFGRQVKEFLPVMGGQSLNYRSIDSSAVTNYYNTPAFPTMETTTTPFSEKLFEKSPLNRVLKQGAPGSDWALGTHDVKMDFQTNTDDPDAVYSVKLFRVNTLWNSTLGVYDITLIDGGNYPANSLFENIIKDENWTIGNMNTIHIFKDKEGREIMKRNFEINTKGVVAPLDTYYVYDIFGNLTYVIPPSADISLSGVLDELCYQYKYDSRNRLVESKLPGKQWEFLVYDKLDRLVMKGPVKTPFYHLVNDGWSFTKYDDFNRVVMTGWMTSTTINSGQRKIKQDERNSQTILSEQRLSSGVTPSIAPSSANNPTHSYTNLSLPITGYYILTINYYDDYNYVDAPSLPVDIETQPVYYNNTIKPIGLSTGKWEKVLDVTTSQASSKKQTTYILYDYKARPIRTSVKNYENSPGWTQVDTKLDFEGKTERTVTSHRRTANDPGALTITDNYTYTDQSRKLSHSQMINSGSVQLIAENSYNDFGNITSKKVGNTSSNPLQIVDYAYNIRGWLKSINNDSTDNLILNSSENDLFSFKINYNNIQNGVNYFGKALYNGNIAETYWRTSSDNTLRKYGYLYDGLNRLTNAIYQKPGNAVPEPGTYNESISYDTRGNILTLKRNGGNDGVMPEQEIDNLSYFYANNNNSNRLIKVSENFANASSGFVDGINTGDDYSYDNFGNIKTDLNKGITNILYNHLNLPVKVTFGSIGDITFIYNSEGKKLEKIVTQGATTTTTKYLEGFQYTNNVLQFFPTAEGYVRKTGNTYGYVFNYTDHLGNIRLSYRDSNNDFMISNNEIIEENHYYPYGLKHSYNNTVVSDYRYKYNGKEYQDELGLNMYDYGARNYDAAIGRWINMDSMTENYYPISPYSYGLNNPNYFIDPDGNYIEIYYGEGSSQHQRYKYQRNRDYSKIESPFLADALRALDAVYQAANIEVDGETVNIMDGIMNSEKELSIAKSCDDCGSNFGSGRAFSDRANNSASVYNNIGTIYFDNENGVLFDDVKDSKSGVLRQQLTTGKFAKTAKTNSPTSIFGHEMAHAFGFFTDPSAYLKRKEDKSSQSQSIYFKNQEEARATTLSTQINIQLKENPRANHRGINVPTQNVLSNKIKL